MELGDFIEVPGKWTKIVTRDNNELSAEIKTTYKSNKKEYFSEKKKTLLNLLASVCMVNRKVTKGTVLV